MKIALVSTSFFSFPPTGYSGLEMLVYSLAGELAKQHKVVVFAPKGRNPPKGFLYECCEPINTVNVDWLGAERKTWERFDPIIQKGEFDIIVGANWFGMEYASKAKNLSLKVAHWHHGGLNLEWWNRSRPPFKLNLIAISDWMVKVYASQGFTARRCWNGIDISQYGFNRDRGDRLLFVGRISNFKGPHIAIKVAERLGMKLDVLGGTFVESQDYVRQIKSACEKNGFGFYPDASHEIKLRLMQNAKCLLFPSLMGEPWGMVGAEMMATGGVVVALNDGAIPEVIGDAGIVCDVFGKNFTDKGLQYTQKRDPVEAMVEAVKRIDEIKPEACRKRVLENFTSEKMCKAHLQRYNEILNGDEW